ncbi:PQQ-binding-like beta-propeller repeat protein [Salinicola sp. RZ23]|uniref:outer membrane protein assembly factor BamB family protein n=1 Tax=Salinicola sp. RZ23 TaxID=1949087 RepID=UPI0013008334|nr:PQQ-binding-like beta-propeller repeat protein [Salinicola sp. RZ23]
MPDASFDPHALTPAQEVSPEVASPTPTGRRGVPSPDRGAMCSPAASVLDVGHTAPFALAAPDDRISVYASWAEIPWHGARAPCSPRFDTSAPGYLQRRESVSGALLWQLDVPDWARARIITTPAVGVAAYTDRPLPASSSHCGEMTPASGLLAFDLHSGAPLWHQRYAGGGLPFPLLHAGEVYVGGGDRAIHALSLHDGHQTGCIGMGAPVDLATALLDDQGRLFLSDTEPARLLRIDPLTRAVLWMAELPEAVAASPGAPPAVEAERVAMTLAVRDIGATRVTLCLFGFDAASGERVWEVTLGERDATHPPALAAPLADSERFYVISARGELVVIDALEGRERQRLALGDPALAAASLERIGDHLVITAPGGNVQVVPLALLA